MQDPVADMLMVDEIKDLGLVNVTGIGPGVEDAVRVHREVLAVAFPDALLKAAADGLGATGGIRRETGLFLPVQMLAKLPQVNHI
jgi:hypothetical protein